MNELVESLPNIVSPLSYNGNPANYLNCDLCQEDCLAGHLADRKGVENFQLEVKTKSGQTVKVNTHVLLAIADEPTLWMSVSGENPAAFDMLKNLEEQDAAWLRSWLHDILLVTHKRQYCPFLRGGKTLGEERI